jgi:CubicO group peptidase (beta-lactamase class C family)
MRRWARWDVLKVVVVAASVACGTDPSSEPTGGSDGGSLADPDSGGLGGSTGDAARPEPADGGQVDGASDPGDDAGSVGAWTPDYFPTVDWRTRTPAEAGYDEAKLEQAVAFAQSTPTQGLLVVQDGYIVREEYWRGFSATQRHESYSMAKSFASALVGIAIEEKLLTGVDERLCKYYPAWDCANTSDPRSQIELRHVMTLSSGLTWQEEWEAGTSFADNDAIAMSISPRPIDYVLAKPSAHPPGTHFQYSTGDPALLSGVLQAVTGKTALAYAREKLFVALGTPDIQWNSDRGGNTTTFAGLSATVREYAKFGFLYLNRGRWEDEQLVASSWVDLSTRPGPALEAWYGYLWHVNLPVRFEDPALPADGYTAQGVSGQFLTVIPSERLVLVRVADDGIGAAEFDLAGLLGRVLAAKTRM